MAWVGWETGAQTGTQTAHSGAQQQGEKQRFLESVRAAGELQPQLGNTSELA